MSSHNSDKKRRISRDLDEFWPVKRLLAEVVCRGGHRWDALTKARTQRVCPRSRDMWPQQTREKASAGPGVTAPCPFRSIILSPISRCALELTHDELPLSTPRSPRKVHLRLSPPPTSSHFVLRFARRQRGHSFPLPPKAQTSFGTQFRFLLQ